MIECYYKWCKHHEYQFEKENAEPLCTLNECVATEEESKEFAKKRELELKGL